MSLSYSFQLTPRQTELLLIVCTGQYRDIGDGRGGASWLPDWEMSHFVPVASKLREKGLITHDNNRNPTFYPTDMGRAMADSIIADARKLVAMADDRKPLPKPEMRNKKQTSKR